MRIGERLRAARQEREMSLADLARATKLSKGFISQVESGVSNPSLASLRKLTEALGLNPGEPLDDPPITQALSTPEREPLIEGITVHPSLSSARAGADRIVPVVANSQQGSGAIFTLLPGETVRATASVANARGVAICAVLLGTVRLERTGAVAVARQGDVASFYPGAPYDITNLSSGRARFFLTVPVRCELPRQVNIARNRGQALESKPPVGPFRIVEMRAGRDVRERGR